VSVGVEVHVFLKFLLATSVSSGARGSVVG
jgi:hypothetical protein